MLSLQDNFPTGLSVPPVNAAIRPCAECFKAYSFLFSDEIPYKILKIRK